MIPITNAAAGFTEAMGFSFENSRGVLKFLRISCDASTILPQQPIFQKFDRRRALEFEE